jgi:hypothetical protein
MNKILCNTTNCVVHQLTKAARLNVGILCTASTQRSVTVASGKGAKT